MRYKEKTGEFLAAFRGSENGDFLTWLRRLWRVGSPPAGRGYANSRIFSEFLRIIWRQFFNKKPPFFTKK
jgi:hypothetical protein